MRVNPVVYTAVELMVRLAAADRAFTVDKLSEQIAESPLTTAALLARLQKAGLVQANEALPQGYNLGRPAALITAADVFEAVDWGEETCGPNEEYAVRRTPDAFVGVDLLWVAIKNCSGFYLRGISLADLVNDPKVTVSAPNQPPVAATRVGPGRMHRRPNADVTRNRFMQ